MQWRDMESAPRDGTRILLWRQFERGEPVIARYVEGKARGPLGRFVWVTDGDGSIAESVPTHWAPIEPPN